jgi:surfeit locus 1 family protein
MAMRFSPGWPMTLFTGAFLPVLMSLGVWQLDRESEKLALQSLYDQRQSGPALALEQIDWSMADLSYQKVRASGHYDNQRYFLLDNRIQEGRVGYEVLMPFVTPDGDAVILNRGWIAQGESRLQLPEIEPIEGEASIEGSLYVPLSEPFMLSNIQEVNAETWPQVVQKIDITAWSDTLDLPLRPYTVRLTQESTGALLANWQTINMLPEKHKAYAVQWFSMAAALVLMYLYFGTRNPQHRSKDE